MVAASSSTAIQENPGELSEMRAFSRAEDLPSPASPLNSPARVVIVDESPEAREVLRTLLETRGVESVEAPCVRAGLELMRLHRPEVVVFDLDAVSADDESLRDALDCEARDHDAALIVLGKARRYVDSLPTGQVLSKPYHYAPLIRTIERLLAR